MIRVLVVDDHEVLRAGVCLLIDRTPDMLVVGESGSVSRTMGLVAATRPDVVVLDVNLPDGNGITLCRTLHEKYPNARSLILTGYGSEEASQAAMLAGASGYVLKTVHGNNLVESIRRAAQAQPPAGVGPAAGRAIASAMVGTAVEPHLTHREHQVLVLIADGMSNREIAATLGLREKTVKNYVSGLLASLGMSRRTQAAVYGARHRH